MPDIMAAPGHLLVVDDNKVNRLLMTRSVEQQGHKVSTAENGRIALEMLRRENYDILLLDMEMPEMDGFQVLHEITNDIHLRDIPVIVTSSLEGIDNIVRCIQMGAEDYLTKPVNPVILKARINASLEKKRLRDQQRKLFRTFATPEVAEELLQKGFSLGGKHVIATVMFSDIRSFTSIAEKQNPADIIELLNDYFALMFDAISGHGGTLNQMTGDGLMAVFGAPLPSENHCEQAVRAALEMLDLLEAFNQQQAVRGKVQLEIGIGIATGRVIAGYTGTQHRATYTCIGDTVNLASRIESHTKVAARPILIDKYTREGLPEEIRIEPLGALIFKGKEQPIEVFAIRRT